MELARRFPKTTPSLWKNHKHRRCTLNALALAKPWCWSMALHGRAGPMARKIDSLSLRFEVIAVELPGFGDNHALAEPAGARPHRFFIGSDVRRWAGYDKCARRGCR